MSYFERLEKLGQLNIFHYLAMDSLLIEETVAFQDVKITRQSRFFEVETDRVHEAAKSLDDVLCLLAQ